MFHRLALARGLYRTVCIFFALVASAGCMPTVRALSSEVPRTATPVFVDSGLQTLEQRETRERIAAILATPEMQRAMREVASGMSRGVMDAMSDADIKSLAETIARSTVDAAMHEATSPANQEAAQRFAGAVTAAVVRSLSDEIPKSLVPAVRDSIQNDVAPSLAAALRSQEFRDALGEATRDVAKNAVLGSNDALAYLAQKREQTHTGGPLGAFGQMLAGQTWLVVLLVAVALIGVLLALFLKDRAAANRYREQSERRLAEATALVSALEAAGDEPFSRDVLALLKKGLLAIDETAPAETKHPAHTRRHRHA